MYLQNIVSKLSNVTIVSSSLSNMSKVSAYYKH